MDLGKYATMPDAHRATSLKELSEQKARVVKEAMITTENISVFFCVMYDALHEALSAYVHARGYKVPDHYTLGCVMHELNAGFSTTFFERCRKGRNRINYYGKIISFERGTQLIEKMDALRRQYAQKHL